MQRRWLAAGLVMAALPVAILVSIATGALASPQAAAAGQTRTINHVTLYGFPDNSPPGNGTAFGSGHAGGVGTFGDPTTFATDQHEFAPGTLIYYPFLQRYFVMQDECVECDADFNNGISHIDLWVGGTASSNSSAVIACEDNLTRDNMQIIVNPGPNEPVFNNGQGGVIFQNGQCNAPGGGGGGGGSGNTGPSGGS
ncbi:MAG TPA: hypothetical protein VGS19_14695 [Streptosporangiaceae bacterium]|nr:hypothetical protein [Streptosporangiaceae bacterium]